MSSLFKSPSFILACLGILIQSGLGWADIIEAKQLMAQKKWEDAAVLLRNSQKKNPQSFETAQALSEVLLRLHRREEAVSILSQFSSPQAIHKQEVISRIFFEQAHFKVYQEGVHLIQAGKIKPAKEKFNQALELEPNHVDILLRLSQSLLLDADADSAVENLKLAKRLNPFEPEIRLWLGRALHQRGEFNAAIDEFRVAMEKLKTSQNLPLWLSEAYLSVGQKQIAEQVLTQDLQTNPYHLKVLLWLVKFRLDFSGSHKRETVWEARKDLQLATSRLKDYFEKKRTFETDLGVEQIKTLDEYKADVLELQQKVDAYLGEI